ncbi:MAG: peptide chain release factor 2 [Acholeplasmatales bacterium]|nr:peptide chain release factor 2 [Acholeplasmatales bacterium]
MEKYEINKYLTSFEDKLNGLEKSLNISHLKEEIDKLTKLTLAPDFWDKPVEANIIISNLNSYKENYDSFMELKLSYDSINELLELDDSSSFEELGNEVLDLDKKISEFETMVLLSGKYDSYNALLEIHPGQGGTEALDWADMLFRMYQNFCKNNNLKIRLINYEPGEVGIKSLSCEITGKNAYGLLQSERGVHRLVRISPFDSNKRRHTTFCSVDIAPEIQNDFDIIIADEDLRVDTFMSSGHGGQGVNTTYSAVRLTYLPLNIVVTCQNERSQLRNKEEALKVLKSKLLEIEILKADLNLKEIKGEQLQNGFGSQIRSYVFTPYTMVKDHRTNAETADIKGVMDGNIEMFVNAYLNMKAGEKNEKASN